MQNVGMIGLGAISKRHLQSVEHAALANLVAVAETDPDGLASVQSQYRCKAYADYRALLQDEQVDMVIICLPHGLHCEASEAALEAGKHVLVEKPMAVTVDQCDRMIESARKHQRHLSVGHMHHFFPANVEVKRLLDTGELGSLVLIREEGYRPFGLNRANWYFDRGAKGGLWYQNGIHLIDRCCFWVGSPVVAVKATIGSRFYEFSADDVAMAMLQFENGVYATLIHVWWKQGGTHASTEFVCTDGMIRLAGLTREIWVGRTGDYEPHPIRDSYNAFDRQLEAFIAAIEDEIPPPVTPEYARDLVRVLVACEASSRTGREVLL